MLKLWKESFEEKLDTETKSRIIYYKKQMEAFKFYFGFQLGCKLYVHTENLSKTLQQESLQSKGSHRQTSPYKLWKAYVVIATTTFSTKVLKNQVAKSRLSQNRPFKTEHAKLQYPSVCQRPQIWRTSSSRNCTHIFQGNLQRSNWYHYQFVSRQVWAT